MTPPTLKPTVCHASRPRQLTTDQFLRATVPACGRYKLFTLHCEQHDWEEKAHFKSPNLWFQAPAHKITRKLQRSSKLTKHNKCAATSLLHCINQKYHKPSLLPCHGSWSLQKPLCFPERRDAPWTYARKHVQNTRCLRAGSIP